MTTKRCGTCEYFRKSGQMPTGTIFGLCDCPVPIIGLGTQLFNRATNENAGVFCPAHKPRTPKEIE